MKIAHFPGARHLCIAYITAYIVAMSTSNDCSYWLDAGGISSSFATHQQLKDGPADAHDAGRLGVLWQRTLQLMLMMLAGLGFFGEELSS